MTTNFYSKGVLIGRFLVVSDSLLHWSQVFIFACVARVGNWSEEQSGNETGQTTVIPAANPEETKDHFTSVTRASFRPIAKEHLLESLTMQNQSHAAAMDRSLQYRGAGIENPCDRRPTKATQERKQVAYPSLFVLL